MNVYRPQLIPNINIVNSLANRARGHVGRDTTSHTNKWIHKTTETRNERIELSMDLKKKKTNIKIYLFIMSIIIKE